MSPIDNQRPDPDALLAQVQAQERSAARGKLRIYFGAAAGVGKTYAMLVAAHKLQADGHDVLVGAIEAHGRAETALQMEGLLRLPLKSIKYRGKTITEFDIDAALERHPPLILIDELAHSNAPGSRNRKRWQDVHELLDAGIDVFTTVNVQHLESLSDAVGGITGVRVSETLPDTVFNEAQEVVLVDIPADELLARLKSGKVYQLQHVERASRNFFRKRNLIALRELALRRTADRVESDVQAYRIEKSISAVWKTDAALLACLGPRQETEHVIQSAARLANQLNTAWHAIYVETPQLQRLPSERRERILQVLQMASDMGAATTAVLPGIDISRTVVDYARSQNFSKIILGRSHAIWPWRTSRLNRIAAMAPDVDLIEIGVDSPAEMASADGSHEATSNQFEDVEPGATHQSTYWRYLWAACASLGTALLATPLLPYFDLANIIMLFLMTVVLVASGMGKGPAALATVVGVAAFDFFFVTPRFSFAASDFQYLVSFAVMLVVGLITAHLTTDLRYQARAALHRESRSLALYEFARELSGALQTEQILETTRIFIQRTFRAQAILILPDDNGRLQLPSIQVGEHLRTLNANTLDMGIAQWAFDQAAPAGIGTDTLPASSIFYLPLVAPMRTRGLLAIRPEGRRWIRIPEQRQQLDTFAALAAIALERVHYIEVAQNALVHMESERLRNSLLAILSHDLRTPLTSLVGLADLLTLSKSSLTPAQLTLAEALRDEILRMSGLVTNLLDMARIQSGDVRLNLQWQPFEEAVGNALRICRPLLAGHRVETRLSRELPLVRFDAMLIERVMCNLLENAAKYTPSDSHVVIAAEVSGRYLDISVFDNGPGLPPGREESLFEKFTRGERESATSGVGLGLSICRAIVEAHGGTIRAGKSPEGGASFIFTLPLGAPPVISGFNSDKAAPGPAEKNHG